MNCPRVVLDTNVLVAALRSRRGASFQILSLVGSGRFEVVLSVPLVLEYEQVLGNKKPQGIAKPEIAALVDYICTQGHYQEIHYLWHPFLRDPKDDLVLEVAVAGDCRFIVTHNLRDFSDVGKFGLHAISPADFFTLLKGS